MITIPWCKLWENDLLTEHCWSRRTAIAEHIQSNHDDDDDDDDYDEHDDDDDDYDHDDDRPDPRKYQFSCLVNPLSHWSKAVWSHLVKDKTNEN